MFLQSLGFDQFSIEEMKNKEQGCGNQKVAGR